LGPDFSFQYSICSALGPATGMRVIGRSLLLGRLAAVVEVKTPVQTVHADFPHTAYR
jgi:hypothetical protein